MSEFMFCHKSKTHMVLISQKSNSLMSKRITIMLDDDLATKLRKIQAESIKKSNGSTSFSYVVNETLKKGLKV